MKAPSNGFAKGLIARALLFAGIAVTPCASADQVQSATDSVAVQLIQLLNENEALVTEIAALRGQVEELLERSERSRESQLQIAADFAPMPAPEQRHVEGITQHYAQEASFFKRDAAGFGRRDGRDDQDTDD